MARSRIISAAVAALALTTATLTGTTSGAIAGGTGHGSQPSKAGIIVWSHRAAPGSEHLMIARADATNVRPLTLPKPDTTALDAQISPDGRWVAYEQDTADSAGIRLVRTDGRDDHSVDVGCVDPCAAVVSPTWLSDKRLAFTRVVAPFDEATGNAASAALWSSRVDGSDVRRVSAPSIDGTYEDYYLRASRDGDYLTFRRLALGDGTSALFRMGPDGRHLHQLTPWNLRAEVNDLSTARRGPTEDLVVFESYGRGDPDATFADIATVPATCRSLADCTARIHWLTDNGTTGRRNANPQWSPDGTSLVFTDRPSIDDPDANIWTGLLGQGPQLRISPSPEFDYRPTWGRG